MSDDILERIQAVDCAEVPALLAEASDEIKRLRARNNEPQETQMKHLWKGVLEGLGCGFTLTIILFVLKAADMISW